jgi:hypothetical protein
MKSDHDKWNLTAGKGVAASTNGLGLMMCPSLHLPEVCQQSLRFKIYELAYESAVLQVRAAATPCWSFDHRWN